MFAVLRYLKPNRLQIRSSIAKRFLLSSSYMCDNEWNSQVLKAYDSVNGKRPISFNDFAFQISQTLDNEKPLSAIDYDYYVSNLSDMELPDIEYNEDIFKKFNATPESLDILPASNHSILRTYLNLGQAPRFVSILTDKFKYGIFLDNVGTNMLLDNFIESKNVNMAFDVAWDYVLQEDFSDSLNVHLAFRAAVDKLQKMFEDGIYQPAEPQEEDDEEVAVVLQYINIPYYDNHFDIKCPKLKLGKCFDLLAANINESSIALSCRLIGTVLYEKISEFDKLFASLDSSIKLPSDLVEILDWAAESITEVQPEEEQEPPLPHEMRVPRLTSEELEKFKSGWQDGLREKLVALCSSEIKLSDAVNTFVKSHVAAEEPGAREKVLELYKSFAEERVRLQTEQNTLRVKKTVEDEVKQHLRDLLDKEETITYFDNIDTITYKAWLADRTREEKAITEKQLWEEDVANVPRIQRRTKTQYEQLNYEQ